MVQMDANGIVLATENHDVAFFGHEHQDFFRNINTVFVNTSS
jgi:predicted phosphodiesterase